MHRPAPHEQAPPAIEAVRNESFIAFLNPGDARSILEVGRGPAMLADQLARRWPHIEVHGVSTSAAQPASASMPGGESIAPPRNLHLQDSDVCKLPFASSAFDLVYCRHLLAHLSSPIRALQEMARVARPGGRVCVEETNMLSGVLDPECARFEAVRRKVAALRTRLGGDATIGRRLLPLLKQVGLIGIQLSIAPEAHWSGSPGFAPWVEELIADAGGAAEKLVESRAATREEIDGGLDDLRRLLARSDASAFFYYNRAAGTKP